MSVDLSSDAQRWLGRLPEIVNVVLIALVALSAAHLVWLVWPEPTPRAVAPVERPADDSTARQARVNIQNIADAHLFGEQQAEEDAPVQQEIEAPETQLNLVLTGIIAADGDRERSRALIQNQRGEQESYRAGQQIASGVDLHDIYANRVILDRNGRFETLTLESVKNAQAMTGLTRTSDNPAPSGQASTGQSTTANSGASASDLGSALAEARREILADPSLTQRYIRLQPAREDGSLTGYRVFPGEDNSLFQKAGLEGGEVVTAINGKPLTSTAATMEMLSNLANADSATLTIEHDGTTRDLQVNFR